MGITQREVAEPALRSLSLIQAGNRTRVVFNLNKPQTFETTSRQCSPGHTVDQATPSAQAQQVQRFAEAKSNDTPHALRDIDFRRGKGGEGRIVIDLSDNTQASTSGSRQN
jgi:type IV pilus assembly protein PilQ